MAKREVNRSQAIRDAINEMPKAKAKEIVAHLNEKGIKVSDQLVYQVKKMGKKRGRKPKEMAPAMSMNHVGRPKVHMTIAASVALVRTTAEKVGGMKSLREIVDALS